MATNITDRVFIGTHEYDLDVDRLPHDCARFFSPTINRKITNRSEVTQANTPRPAANIETLLARLPKIQAQSLDPDEEGDLPILNETVQNMARFLRFLEDRFSSNGDLWSQSSLSANPAGNLEISWRANGNSVIFIVKKDTIVSVVKKAGEQPQRHVLNETVEESMIR